MAKLKGKIMGSLYKRRHDGPWYIAWNDAKGKRHCRSAKTTDRRAAELILNEITRREALIRDGVMTSVNYRR